MFWLISLLEHWITLKHIYNEKRKSMFDDFKEITYYLIRINPEVLKIILSASSLSFCIVG